MHHLGHGYCWRPANIVLSVILIAKIRCWRGCQHQQGWSFFGKLIDVVKVTESAGGLFRQQQVIKMNEPYL